MDFLLIPVCGGARGRRVSARAWARKMEGAVNKWVSLLRPLPTHLVYWTVNATEDGRIRFYPDAYNYDELDRQLVMSVAEQRLAGLPPLAGRLPAGPAAD